MQKIFFELKCIPDLELSKYSSLSDSGVDGVIERQNIFLKQWNKICQIYNISMHLLYTYTSNAKRKMRCYFILCGEDNLADASKLLLYSPIGEYYCFEQVDTVEELEFAAASILVKKDRTVSVETEKNTHFDIGVVPMWEMNDNSRLIDMFRMLKALGDLSHQNENFAYRIDLFPKTMSEEMREAFQPFIIQLRKCTGEIDDKIVLSNSQIGKHKDDSAREVLKLYENFLEMLDVSQQFETHILAFADNQSHADIIIGAAGSEAVLEGYYDLLPLGKDADGKFHSFSRMELGNTVYSRIKDREKYSSSYLKWNVIFSCQEVSAFFRLPALYEGEVIDIPKETVPIIENDNSVIRLGEINKTISVEVPLKNFVKHTMICGVPGSGKTNTMLQLATQFWADYHIPFLIFEPAKKEYRALLNDERMKDVLLFSPKIGSKFPIRINPFEFPLGLALSEHIGTLMSVFGGSFSLQGPTHYFLDMSIQKAYENKGWFLEKVNDGTLEYPSLSDVYTILESEVEKSGYDGEIKGNVKSFLQVRLGGLMKRDAGAIFNTEYSTLAIEDWFKYPIIVELEALDNQDKNFFVLLMCSIIMEILRVNPNADMEKQVRHFIFIEEAHNLIAQTTQQSSSDSVDPKISATAFVVKMLAEVRALREAIIITDQLPSALAPEVMKNTSLKIVHRLTAQDDRSMIGGTMAATSMQLDELATYNVGEAMVFYEKLRKPFKLQMIKWKSNDQLYTPMEPDMLHAKLLKCDFYRKQYNKTIYIQVIEIYEKEYTVYENQFLQMKDKIKKAALKVKQSEILQDKDKEVWKYNYETKVEEYRGFRKELEIFGKRLNLFVRISENIEECRELLGIMNSGLKSMQEYEVESF